MLPGDRERYPPVETALKDNRVIVLRALEPRDADALSDFYESVPRADFRFYCPHPLNREEARAKAARADSPNFVCVVGIDGEDRMAGYGWYDWEGYGGPLSHFGLCIRRGYQDCGTGQALMRRVLEIARDVGPERMCLTVQQANTRAFALYRKMGFEVIREQTREARFGFESEPDYYMERWVRSPVERR